jgi:hypothetical protein
MSEPKSASRATPSKSAFVARYGLDVPAAKVVADALAAGMSITANHVYAVRSDMKKKKKPGKRAASAAKKASPTPKKAAKVATPAKPTKTGAARGPKPDKRAFIESQPRTATATAILAAAKKAGLSISDSYVRIVRGHQKPTAPAKPQPAPTAPIAAVRSSDPVEMRLAAIVLEVGVVRAEELLRAVTGRLKAAATK